MIACQEMLCYVDAIRQFDKMWQHDPRWSRPNKKPLWDTYMEKGHHCGLTETRESSAPGNFFYHLKIVILFISPIFVLDQKQK